MTVLILAGLLLRVGAFKLIGFAAALAAESASAVLAMFLLVRFGWIPVSGKKYLARESSPGPPLGAAAASMLIRWSRALADAAARWLPGPYGWLLRRKLLYLMRTDPVYLAIHVGLTLILSVQFTLTWGFNMSAVFTLVNLLLCLTLLQIAFREPDARYGACAHFLPPRRYDYRVTVFLYLCIASILFALFAAGCILHMGLAGALTYRAFWHVLATSAALPFLLACERPYRGPAGEAWTYNSRIILNFCYLGLAGWLFMFSWAGVLTTVVVLFLSMLACLRIAIQAKTAKP